MVDGYPKNNRELRPQPRNDRRVAGYPTINITRIYLVALVLVFFFILAKNCWLPTRWHAIFLSSLHLLI